LVYGLRVRESRSAWNVVTLVDQDATVVLNSIGISRSASTAHQDDTDPVMEPEVHPSLKTRSFFLAHLQVRHDFSRFKHVVIVRGALAAARSQPTSTTKASVARCQAPVNLADA
jgi:hypothetical protein